jgi:Ca2+-binding RTX toxin-like protein
MSRFTAPAAITQHGDEFDNSLSGTDGDDSLYGEGGNDQIFNSGGTDLLDGGDGNDTLFLDFQRSVFDPELGRRVFVTNISAGDQLVGGAGTDTIWIRSDLAGMADLTQVSIAADVEKIRLETFGSAKLTSDQLKNLSVLQGDFTIVGSGTYTPFGGRLEGNLTLGDGDDTASLEGGSGNATLHGGGGNDVLTAGGSAGNRQVFGDDGDDMPSAAAAGLFTSSGGDLNGGAGNDTLQGNDLADRLAPGTGIDIVNGAGGDDEIWLDPLSGPVEADQISGGTGTDTLVAIGSPNLPWTLDLGIINVATDVERINAPFATVRGTYARLDQFQSIIAGTIQFTDAAAFVPVAKFQATSFALGDAGGSLDASASQSQGYRLAGGAGNDRLAGGGAADRLFSGAGTDDLAGGGGDDGLYFGAFYGAGDLANGGAGTDTLALQGDYAGGTSLAGMSNVEVLLVASGADTRFGDLAGNAYDYRLSSTDANVAAGSMLTVIATGLGVDEDLAFDGSAESDGSFRVYAGRGVDALTGGGGNDGFFFGDAANLTAADRIDGGAGTDTLALRGQYAGADAVHFLDASFTRVEVLALLSSHSNEYTGAIVPTGFDYDVTIADGNVAAGQSLDVNASRLGADESVRFDGRAETDGSLRILSGAGDDQIWGGGQADSLYGGLGADQLDGGAGADAYVYRSAAESTTAARDTIVFGTGDHIDLSLIDAVAGSPGSNEGFAFIGSAAFSQTAGELRAFQSGSDWTVEADVNGDGLADLVLSVITAAPLVASDFVP